LPDEFEEVYLCHLLGLSYTELKNQPDWWVKNYVRFLEQKGKQESDKLKAQQALNKMRSGKKR